MERNLFWGLFLILLLNSNTLFSSATLDTKEDDLLDGSVSKKVENYDNYDEIIASFSIEEAFLYEIGLLEKFQNEKNDDTFYSDELNQILKSDFIELIASPVSNNLIKHIQKRKMPLFINEYVEMQIDHLSVKKRDFVEKSLKRAEPYIKEMKEIFKENDIPEDLAYLPLIESGFVNYAKSYVGATGMWQFMPGTARWMGMKMDNFIDERRDPIIACRFAAKFLSFLYERLGDWHLVLAAYNHGGMNVINEMKKAKTNYYYDLVKTKVTPKETRDYVPRFVASVMIIKNLEKYGFQAMDESSDYVYYKAPFSTPAFVVAKHSNMKLDDFLKLNPSLKDGYVPEPKYDYKIRLPKQNYDILMQNYDDLKKDTDLSYIPYYIKQGDTLSGIAVKFGLSVAFIIKTNNLKNPNKLSLGQKIYIPLRGYQVAKVK